MARLFVAVGHNQINKLIRIAPCLSIDFSDGAAKTMDNIRFKSLLKTISRRVLASTNTLMIAWLLTGNLKTAGSIMLLEIFTKMFLYWMHERFWTRFLWVRNRYIMMVSPQIDQQVIILLRAICARETDHVTHVAMFASELIRRDKPI